MGYTFVTHHALYGKSYKIVVVVFGTTFTTNELNTVGQGLITSSSYRLL